MFILTERKGRRSNKTLQPTCYPYDCSTVNENEKLFAGSNRHCVARTRLNSALSHDATPNVIPMTERINPYEPSSVPPAARVDVVLSLGSSIVWFGSSCLVLNTGFYVGQHCVAQGQPLIAGSVALGLVTSIIQTLLFHVCSLVVRRSFGPTRRSLVAAATVVCTIMFGWLWISGSLGISGPPGLVSGPIALFAGVVTDRTLARMMAKSATIDRTQ